MGRTQKYPHFPFCSSCGEKRGGSKYKYTPGTCDECKVQMKQLAKIDRQRKQIMDDKLNDMMAGRLLGDDRHFPAVVYEIQSPEGETYYGSTDTPGRRFQDHINDLKKSKHCNKNLQSAWDKVGGIGFTFTIISEHHDRRSAFDAELKLIRSGERLLNSRGGAKYEVLTPAQISDQIDLEIQRLREDPF